MRMNVRLAQTKVNFNALQLEEISYARRGKPGLKWPLLRHFSMT
jgi:hypothetical protein